MAFLDPKSRQQDDEALPGAAGLHLELDTRVCPECGREAMPWEDACPDCLVATVLPQDLAVRPSGFGHLLDEEERRPPEQGDPEE